VLPLVLPPLRQRREDIAPLVEHLLARAAAETGRPGLCVSLPVLRFLEGLDWPGNIRQLQNEIRRAATFAEGSEITLDAFSHLVAADADPVEVEQVEWGRKGALDEYLLQFARRKARDQHLQLATNVARTARHLGISRARLRSLLSDLPRDGASRARD
jgi:DNA-binding NtrC family response regulator